MSQDDLGAKLFKNTEAEATGRLVIEAADALGVPADPEIAQLAFAALATDTGWFRFASTAGETYRTGGPAGGRRGPARRDLQGTLRARHPGAAEAHRADARPDRTELGGRLIYTWIEQGDFAASGAVPSDSEDLINITLTVGGTEVAVILVERQRRRTRSVSAAAATWIAASGRAVRRRRPQAGRRRTRCKARLATPATRCSTPCGRRCNRNCNPGSKMAIQVRTAEL